MNKKVLGIFAFMVIAILGAGFVSAFQFGNGFMNRQDFSEQEIQANHEARIVAIENEDYSAWETLRKEQLAKFEESINEETFNQMIERHQNMEEHRQIMQEARESGDYSKIEQLREESGFQGMGGRGKGNFEGGCPLMGY